MQLTDDHVSCDLDGMQSGEQLSIEVGDYDFDLDLDDDDDTDEVRA